MDCSPVVRFLSRNQLDNYIYGGDAFAKLEGGCDDRETLARMELTTTG